jgi:hypothetical protein
MPSPNYTPQPYQPLASPPPGGYAQFQYGSTTAGADPRTTHAQIYRPTEHEAGVVDHANPEKKERSSNMGKRAEKVEKGVGKFLKKLDKKF